jgi:hypothetical protein
MSRTQRLALLGVAAIIAVLAVVVLPGSDDPRQASPAASRQATEAPQTTRATSTERPETTRRGPEREPQPPLLRAGRERELQVTKGERVRFRVRHPTAEEVHVHGYDISRELEPGRTETLSFEAELEGIFEVELERSGAPLATLTVKPR